MDRAAEGTDRRRVPGEGHGVSRRYGGPRAVRQTLPRLWLARATHRLRRQRGELLRQLPDRRPPAGGQIAVATDARRLAAHARRTGKEAARDVMDLASHMICR